jgi:HD superfamily phosphohydrolase
MYWQVYNHRTVVSAEKLLTSLLVRAREVTMKGITLFATPALTYFLHPRHRPVDNEEAATMIRNFTTLDESDIISATKVWMCCNDKVLSDLCRRFVNRDLLGIELQNSPFDEEKVTDLRKKAGTLLQIGNEETRFYVNTGDVYNQTYAPGTPEVRIRLKNGITKDITAVSDLFDKEALSEKVTKYYLCYPKELLHN